MFCNKCGCILPAVAKFCAKCGSRVETSTAPASSGSFCVDCGKQCDPAYKFCNFYGHPLPGVQNQSETKETVGPAGGPAVPTTGSSEVPSETPAAPTSMPAQIPRAPVRRFRSLVSLFGHSIFDGNFCAVVPRFPRRNQPFSYRFHICLPNRCDAGRRRS